GSEQSKKNGAPLTQEIAVSDAPLQTRVDGLVYAYRTLGHTIADLDPLAKVRPENPLLKMRELGFDAKDLDLVVSSRFFLGAKQMKLREMIAALETIYCGHIATEFMHIQNPRVRNWVREKIESHAFNSDVPVEIQRRVLRQLVKVESFEHFLHTRYQGQKRFSLEGGESLIIALYGVLENCKGRGVEELCMGMAHRGRLSVIAEFLRKPFKLIFTEF